MHVVRLWISEVRAVLEPSAGRIPSDGTVPPESVEKMNLLLRSDSATITYSWDSPGQRSLCKSLVHV